MNSGKKQFVVNFYAGPSAGKSVAAMELTAALKKAGFNAEYVSEYAKDLVLEGRTDELKDQKKVTDGQYARLDRLRGAVDIIVTDSPVLLGLVYGEYNGISDEYAKQIRGYYDSFENFNMFVLRPKNASFEHEGRVHDEQQSIVLDDKIKTMLETQKVFYGTYKRDDIAKTVERISQTYKRLYGDKQTDPTARAEELKHKKEKEMANESQSKTMSNNSTTTVVGKVHKPMELKQITVNGETKTVGNMTIVASRSGTTKDGKPWERQTFYEVSSWNKFQQDELKKLDKDALVVAQGQLEAQGYEKDGNYNISLKLGNASVTALGNAEMSGVQKISAVGRAVTDPELGTTAKGESYVYLPIAVKHADGKATFIDVEAFGETAEAIWKNVKKGSLINASGDVELSSYEKNNGKRGASLKIAKANVGFFDKSAKAQKDGAGKGGAQKDASSGAER